MVRRLLVLSSAVLALAMAVAAGWQGVSGQLSDIAAIKAQEACRDCHRQIATSHGKILTLAWLAPNVTPKPLSTKMLMTRRKFCLL